MCLLWPVGEAGQTMERSVGGGEMDMETPFTTPSLFRGIGQVLSPLFSKIGR